ncbi:TIGR00341 family protein [Dysgonomonas sp. ZJ709]|uniref:TIGR00341 family protein n=1 Tax=Dysgonomonas sp. ZJ709 TaxID=2709797 RepID=UPI0016288CA8|nr:TIGR00341 family protein [Dysgonomonas sp. ZJ709]
MIRKLLSYVSLQGEIEDYDVIHESIKSGIVFKGTNLWILVFAIIIASVGLNVNSTAVIIGAMLISPLMGPINGMGYSIAIYDFSLFKQSIKNFFFAILASLTASTIYFAITPMSTAQSELLARTTPTIYDVLIALFGGLAGIIAISSKQKGNVIPGVAIATALMPPLCTAGYGLATAQFTFFYGAFYLFTINTVCIAISSVAVSQFLKFPIRSNITDGRKKRINQLISVVLAITILPSIYLGYKLVQDEKFNINATKYAESISIYKGNYLLRNKINPTKKEITLIYGGTSLVEEDKEMIIARAKDFSLDKATINIKQGLSFGIDRTDKDKSQLEENVLKQEINRLSITLKNQQLKEDSIKKKLTIGRQLLVEIKPLFPQIEGCSYSEALLYANDTVSTPDKVNMITFSTERELSIKDRERIDNWLTKRLGTNQLKIFYEKVHK